MSENLVTVTVLLPEPNGPEEGGRVVSAMIRAAQAVVPQAELCGYLVSSAAERQPEGIFFPGGMQN